MSRYSATLAISPPSRVRGVLSSRREFRRFTHSVALSAKIAVNRSLFDIKSRWYRLRYDPYYWLQVRHEAAVYLLGAVLMACAWLMMTLAVERATSHQLRGNLAASCAVNPVPPKYWQPIWR